MPESKPSPACVLERIVEVGEAGQDATLIGLHDAHSTASEVLPFLRQIGGGQRIVAPRSARWSAYGRGGLYSWYSSVSPPLVEPVGLGDGLIQLEALVLEEAVRDPAGGITLAGIGQGGTMALVLAALWPELFRAVIAIDALCPTVPGWRLPVLGMSATPVLLAGAGIDAREQLAARGAPVIEIGGMQAGLELASACRQWLSEL